MFYPTVVRGVTLYEGLLRIDEDLSAREQAKGCPHCGGPLDSSPWQRHPRGVEAAKAVVWWRLGLCCRREDCRKRVLPPSVLFLGRRWYWAAVVLVSVASRQRRTVGATATALRRMFGVCRATLARWLAFFATDFPSSAPWRALRGRVSAEVRDDALPAALLAQFDRLVGPGEAALVACLTFLASAVGPGFVREVSHAQNL